MGTAPLLPVMINDLLKNTNGEKVPADAPSSQQLPYAWGSHVPYTNSEVSKSILIKKRSLSGEDALFIIADDQ